jgi:hypothetical protein
MPLSPGMALPGARGRDSCGARRREHAARIVAAFIAGVALPHGAHAADPACAPIIEAMRAMEESHAYHTVSRITRPDGSTTEAEAIVLGQAAYVKLPGKNGEWHEMPLSAAARQNFTRMLERFPPTACQAQREETLNGVATRVYSFEEGIGNPPRPSVGLHDAVGQAQSVNRVWVDKATGRPRKVESAFGVLRKSMLIDYDNVRALLR